MSPPRKVVALGVGAVLLFDLLASLASRGLGFPYARAAIGSYIIYFAIGYFAARASVTHPLQAAAIAAGVAGLADASLGWFISWKLRAAQLPAGVTLTAARRIGIAVTAIVLAAIVGTVGGALGRRRRASSTPAA